MLEDKIYKILENVKNVYEGWYKQDINYTHVTFLVYNIKPTNFSNSDYESIDKSIQVDIWGKDRDEVREVEKQVNNLLQQNNFVFIEGNRDFETDTLIQHNSLRFSFLDVEN